MEPEERTCALPGCGVRFRSGHPTKRYHEPRCAVKADLARRRVPEGEKQSLPKSAASVAAEEPTLEERLEERGLRRENAQLRARLRETEDRLERLQVVAAVRGGGVEDAPPDWLRRPAQTAGHRATVMAILSDTHLDEVVRPSEVGYVNAYDRNLADMRLRRYFERVPAVAHDHFAGAKYDGAVLMLGGDILSGNIHDELVQTNDGLSLVESVMHWTPRLAAGLQHLADEFGRLHVPVIVGNHPRFTKRPRAKLRALDNADWLIGRMLEDALKDDERITFDVPDGTDAYVRVYEGSSFLLTHGDQTTGGGGIGGIWPPVMRMKARKTIQRQEMDMPFKVLVMGHYHQLIMAPGQGLIVNGSVIGYNEYAACNNLPIEQPQQGMWLVTPERGITLQAPVFCGHPDEGWQRRR